MRSDKNSIWWIFSLAELAIAGTISAAETPSPALLVLNKEESSLAIVDPGAGKVAGRVPVGEGPHEVTVSSDGKLAFVGNYGSQTPGSTISVVDVVAQKELRRVDLGALRRPHGIFFSDGKVYFTAEVNKLIGRYDPGSNQIDGCSALARTPRTWCSSAKTQTKS